MGQDLAICLFQREHFADPFLIDRVKRVSKIVGKVHDGVTIGGACREGLFIEGGFDTGDLIQQVGIGPDRKFFSGAGDMGPDVPLHAGHRLCTLRGE